MKNVLSNAFYAAALIMLCNLLEGCGSMNYAGPPKTSVVVSNAVIYSASDGNSLLSMRNQAWILKIDYGDGAGTGLAGAPGRAPECCSKPAIRDTASCLPCEAGSCRRAIVGRLPALNLS